MKYSPHVMCLLIALIGGLAGQGRAQAALANFDSLTEGNQGTTFSDGGVTFFDSFDWNGFSTVFTVEQANATLSGPGFSPNNTLGQGGFSPGPGASFSGTGQFKMTTGSVENFISVDLFTFGNNHIGNSLNLDILLGGSVVGTTFINVTTSAITDHNLSLVGTNFDTARIYGSGSFQNGTVFARFDNVQIGSIPEPSTASIALLGAVSILARRRRSGV